MGILFLVIVAFVVVALVKHWLNIEPLDHSYEKRTGAGATFADPTATLLFGQGTPILADPPPDPIEDEQGSEHHEALSEADLAALRPPWDKG